MGAGVLLYECFEALGLCQLVACCCSQLAELLLCFADVLLQGAQVVLLGALAVQRIEQVHEPVIHAAEHHAAKPPEDPAGYCGALPGLPEEGIDHEGVDDQDQLGPVPDTRRPVATPLKGGIPPNDDGCQLGAVDHEDERGEDAHGGDEQCSQGRVAVAELKLCREQHEDLIVPVGHEAEEDRHQKRQADQEVGDVVDEAVEAVHKSVMFSNTIPDANACTPRSNRY